MYSLKHKAITVQKTTWGPPNSQALGVVVSLMSTENMQKIDSGVF